MIDLDTLQLLLPALLAGALVLTTHVPFGQVVLSRGIVFLDLAVAQIAALGLLLSRSLDFPLGDWRSQLLVFATAVGAALALSWRDRRHPGSQEAIIGSSFVVSASLAVLLLSHDPHAGEYMKDVLAGQILWVDVHGLIYMALLYAVILLLWWRGVGRGGGAGFYALFALAITASVQLVGVYLVFSSLIIPALLTRHVVRWRTAWSWGFGLLAYAAGLLLSLQFDLPAGASVVVSMAVLAVIIARLINRKAVAS
jgi:zinc/manganese transport system permease protein